MKVILKIFSAIGLLGFFLSCHTQQAATRSYDYLKLANHPRLLLAEGEEKLIESSLVRNPEFKRIDTYIKEVCEGLLAEPVLVFEKQGKRLLAVSRKALTRLYYLSYSYRMTGDIRYLDRAEKELNAVCSFETWNPSHFLDVGEMCMAVAIAYDWLYDDLKESTRENVRKAIVEKAFVPSYMPEYASFLERHNNWNPVCNGGLVYGALAIFEDEREQSIAIIERALKSTVLPLQTYAPDGNYPEGPSYWNYGTSFQVMFLDALESALGSDNGLSNAPGFMESAYYMLFASGPSGYYFNYYDCGRSVSASASMFWFADKLDDPTLIYQEIPLINKGIYTRKTNSDEERLLPNALIFGKNLTLSDVRAPSKNVFTGRGITPVSIARTSWKTGEGKYLGIKGGRAYDAHGHMDQGTFVYDVGNVRWAMDFGLQSYITLESKGVDLWNMEQHSQRWDIFRYNNLNHNTLTINNQRHNVMGKAEIIETYEGDRELGAKVDLTPVLNFRDELKTATRKARIVADEYLEVEDLVESNAEPVNLRWNMVTPSSAEIVDKQTIRLSQQGKIMLLLFDANVPFKLVIRPSENPSQYKCEFGDYNYGDYNQENKGTVMVGFDAEIPANTAGRFRVRFIEGSPGRSVK
ncbi:Heparinase II/III-like protein [Parapedobacter composti]|uniref:Heparinase II/III-like protein n=1 Tax=Parapedobacter composti TaxID=623281 RepID=A0A1I1FMP7_9SPHI|nr:heparinase II/III family protein [Parapedobacter composti]SFC00604.1 Heparinase II/III-like protein [Parapedobacter composti]